MIITFKITEQSKLTIRNGILKLVNPEIVIRGSVKTRDMFVYVLPFPHKDMTKTLKPGMFISIFEHSSHIYLKFNDKNVLI